MRKKGEPAATPSHSRRVCTRPVLRERALRLHSELSRPHPCRWQSTLVCARSSRMASSSATAPCLSLSATQRASRSSTCTTCCRRRRCARGRRCCGATRRSSASPRTARSA
eukprot:1053239-Prymnesium_polylepis.1